MRCRHCGSEDYIRNGRHGGVQRFRCRACGRYFRETEPRFGPAVEARALDMYLNNVGIRKIARFTGASPAGVLKWIRKAHKALSEQLGQASQSLEAQMPDVIEMDEIYTFVQKNDAGPSYGLLIAGGRVALLRITSGTRASPAP